MSDNQMLNDHEMLNKAVSYDTANMRQYKEYKGFKLGISGSGVQGVPVRTDNLLYTAFEDGGTEIELLTLLDIKP